MTHSEKVLHRISEEMQNLIVLDSMTLAPEVMNSMPIAGALRELISDKDALSNFFIAAAVTCVPVGERTLCRRKAKHYKTEIVVFRKTEKECEVTLRSSKAAITFSAQIKKDGKPYFDGEQLVAFLGGARDLYALFDDAVMTVFNEDEIKFSPVKRNHPSHTTAGTAHSPERKFIAKQLTAGKPIWFAAPHFNPQPRV